MHQFCYCGSSLNFHHCCSPYIQGEQVAPTAEALMRSRYSAYATGAFEYILATYTKTQRASLSIAKLQQDPVQWRKLDVVGSIEKGDSAQVEFCAYYQDGMDYYRLHELSDFCKEEGQWYYASGHIYPDSGQYNPQRNEPCLCGSGRKFKKCCAK